MRYEDASQAGSITDGAELIARPDVETLAPNSNGPGMGNAISGAGTNSGATGADTVANGPGTIVELQGAGGAATPSGGGLQAAGQYGSLTMGTDGSFNYMRNGGSPDGVQDVFQYTLADAAGARSSTTLTVEIPRVIDQQAVVNLPAGVQMSDIKVIGRDLVIQMPDGTQMVIPGGAVFVPELSIGDVVVPPSNLAALLIDSEPQPAAGPPQSSGGNFADPVPDLDPGAPLGDLIPPTELDYTPPEYEEPMEIVDREPTIIIITPDNPAGAVNAVASVDESGLPERGDEPEGTLEPQSIETTQGTIVFSAEDGLETLTINGTPITTVGQTIAGAHGVLTITSINLEDGTVGYSYTATDNTTDGVDDFEDFTIVVTDEDGDTATGTLHINILDDEPIALDDVDSVDLQTNTATGNVMTGIGTNAGAASGDTVGADNATLTAVEGEGGSDSTFDGDGNLVVDGEHGTLTIDAEGNYTYVPFDDAQGGTTDVFTYSLTDGDGDVITATLTIINPDQAPTAGSNPVVQLDDDVLGGNPGGPNDDPNSVNATGTLSGSGGDGDLTFDLQTTGAPDGFTYVDGPNGSILVQQVQDGVTVTVLTVTVDPATGEYTVVQNANILHPDGQTENNVVFTINYTVTDADGDAVSSSLTVNVDDDTPLAFDDTETMTQDETTETGNVITGAGTNEGTGNADQPGADGFGGIVALVGAESSDSNPSGGFTVQGEFGSLVMDVDGNYTYTRDPNANEGGEDVFTYTYVDGDGDTVQATLTITVPADIPSVGGDTVDLVVDDEALEDGTDPESTAEQDEGTLSFTAGSDPLTEFAFSTDLTGLGGGLTWVRVSDTEIQGFDGDPNNADNLVITLTLEAPVGGSIDAGDSGTVTVVATLNDNYEGHPDVNVDDLVDLGSVQVVASEADGDSVTGTVNVGVSDDLPVGGEGPYNVGTVHEDAIDNENSVGNPEGLGQTTTATIVAAQLAALVDPGADNPVDISLNLIAEGQPGSIDGVDTGLTQYGQTIVYNVNGTTIEGVNEVTGEVVFTITPDGGGDFTFTLLDNIDHDEDGNLGTGEGDSAIENLNLSGVFIATDQDGDFVIIDAAVNLAIENDVPDPFDDTPGEGDDGCPVDFEGVNAPTGQAPLVPLSLNLPDVGADEPYTLSFNVVSGTAAMDSGNPPAPLKSGGEQVYWVIDPNNPGVLEGRTGDEPGEGALVFQITLNENGPGTADDTYTYEQFLQLDSSSEVTIPIGDAIGGGNVPIRGLDVENTELDLVLSTEPGDTINTNAGYIGISGAQAFEAGEVLRIDFLQSISQSGNGPDATVNYGDYYSSNSFRQDVSTQNDNEFANFTVSAFVVDGDGDFLGDAGDTLVADTQLVIYDAAGNLITDLDAYNAGNGADPDLQVIDNGDGSWTIIGLPDDFDFEITSDTPFQAVQVVADADTGLFKLGTIEMTQTIQGDIAFEVPIVLTDSDGDPVYCDIDIILGAAPNNVPTVTIPDQNGEAAGNDSVSEFGLPARPGPEPEGSGEAALPALESDDSEVTTGTFTYTEGDAPATITIDGFNNGDPVVIGTDPGDFPVDIVGEYGTLTITGHDTTTNTVSYTYTLTNNVDHESDLTPRDTFAVRVTDADGQQANGNLVIDIGDDGPVATDDSETQSPEGADVIVDVFANDLPGADDVDISDGTKVFMVEGTLTGAGTVVYNNNGTFTYQPADGEEGEVTFDYTIVDSDGTESTATVTITLDDDSIPSISIVEGSDQSVDEAGLPARDASETGEPEGTGEAADPAAESDDSEIAEGDLLITTGDDDIAKLEVEDKDGDLIDVTNGGTVQGLYGTLVVTGTPETGYSYVYTLDDNIAHDDLAADSETFNIVVTDSDDDTDDVDLVISIADDGPVAADDSETQSPEGADVIVDVFANDLPGADDVDISDGTKVFMVEGTLTGAGTVVYNNNGTFTYQPTDGEEGEVTFDYTIVDSDGTESTATVTITLDDDSIPSISIVEGSDQSVDEAGLPARDATASPRAPAKPPTPRPRATTARSPRATC